MNCVARREEIMIPLMLRRNRFSAVTILEILLVLGIVGFLAGLLTYGLTTARERSKSVTCASNLRQIGLAMAMYRNHYGYYPVVTDESLAGALNGLVGSPEIFRCPSDSSSHVDSYGAFYVPHDPMRPGALLICCPRHGREQRTVALLGNGRCEFGTTMRVEWNGRQVLPGTTVTGGTLTFTDGTTVNIEANLSVVVVASFEPERGPLWSAIRIPTGALGTIEVNAANGTHLDVATIAATVSVEGTRFRVTTTEDDYFYYTGVQVLEGTVTAEYPWENGAPGGRQHLRQGANSLYRYPKGPVGAVGGPTPGPTLLSVAVSGPYQVNENSTANYSCVANFSDGRTVDVSSAASWSLSSPYATIDGSGRLTTSEVNSDQVCRITATYGGRVAFCDVLIKNAGLSLVSIAISGPSQVNENSAANYTCTAHFSDGSTQDVTSAATWQDNSANATIAANGLLTTQSVPADETCRITATYQGKTASLDVTIKNVPVLDHIAVTGPAQVNENSTANYTCTAYYDDGSTQNVTAAATWSEDSDYASIAAGGQLTTQAVTADQPCRVAATYEGKTASLDIIIKDVPPTVERIEIAGPTEVPEDSTANYTCTAYYSDGSSKVVTTEAAWSDNSDYAAIDASGVLTAYVVAQDESCRITATYQGKSASLDITIKDIYSTVQSVVVSGPNYVPEQSTTNYTATANFADGSSKDVTTEATWSEDSAFATIDSRGCLTTIEVTADKICNVKATFRGVSGTLKVTIADIIANLDRLELVGPAQVDECSSATYTCIAYFTDGTTQDVTGEATWSLSSYTYASISGGVVTTELTTANRTVTVTAKYGGKSASRSITILNSLPDITRIEVTGPAEVPENSTANYTCTAYLADDSTRNITTWASWSDSSSFATIDGNGVLTTLEVTADKTCTITATYQGFTGRLTMTIKDTLNITQVVVTGPTQVDELSTAQYTATAYYNDGSTQNVTADATWSLSTGTAYASIAAGGVLTTNEVDQQRTCTVKAAYGGKSGTLGVTIRDVLPNVTKIVVTGPAQVDENSTAQYTATATYSDNSTSDVTNLATWSENSAYASISATGLLTTTEVTNNVNVTVTASLQGKSGSLTVVIKNLANLVSVTVTGPASVPEMDTAQYTCTANYDDGSTEDVTADATWSLSTGTAYASIAAGGVLTTNEVNQQRTCTVKAVYQGKSATLLVTILDTVPNLLAIEVQGPTIVDENTTVKYNCIARYSDGSTKDVSTPAAWSLSAETYATIDAVGNLTAYEVTTNRTVTVRATYAGLTDTLSVTIRDRVVASVAVTGPTTVEEQSTAQYTCTATFTDGSTEDVTAGATWSLSTGTAYASIAAGGVLTTNEVNQQRTCTVKAVYQGKSATLLVTILDSVPNLVSVTVQGPTVVDENTTTQYICVATYSDGNTQIVAADSWSLPSGSAYATIDGNGNLTTKEVTTNRTCSVKATYKGLSHTLSVTIRNVQ